MAALPMVLLAASTVMGAKGAMDQGQAASQASAYNAKLATMNASIADAQGEAASQMQQRDSARKIGAAVAAYGASGVQMSEGSPADVLANSVQMAELDNLTTKYNYKLRGMGYLNQAALDTSNAANSLGSANTSAAASLLGGASKMWGMSAPSDSGTPKFG